MRDVFVVTPASYTTQDFLKRARGLGWSPTVAQNVIGLWSGEEYVDFGELPEVAEYYDEEVGKDALAGCGPEPRFFRLRFRDYKVVTKVILNIFPKNPDFVVDNDHGLLTPSVILMQCVRWIGTGPSHHLEIADQLSLVRAVKYYYHSPVVGESETPPQWRSRSHA